MSRRMAGLPGIRRMLRLPLSEHTVERDIDEELTFHIEARTQDLIARGAAPVSAREHAEREFGDMAASRAELAAVARVRVRRERRADWEHAMPAVRQALHALEPGLPHVQLRALSHRIDPQLQPWRMGGLFAAFGVLALLLAALGLYGVVAYDVAQRTREFGVRLALGARSRNVMGIVLGDAIRVVALGLAAGVALAVWAAPRLESLLFNVAARDHMVLGAVAALLLAVACIAALLPGLRAIRIQPVQALREE
jgi:predicted lysophospholipase L1 biosynthesis ABC-type transport system permease subunit